MANTLMLLALLCSSLSVQVGISHAASQKRLSDALKLICEWLCQGRNANPDSRLILVPDPQNLSPDDRQVPITMGLI